MEQQEAVVLKWKKSSRSQQEIEEMTPDNERTCFDLTKPESSAWIQQILKEATCDDMERRLCALWRFQKVFPLLVQEQGLAEGAESASYLLQRGFLKDMQEGLNEARVSGEWLLLPKSPLKLGLNNFFFINRDAIYAMVVAVMTVDERTARFFLKDVENLPPLLEALFHQAAQPSLAKLTRHLTRMDPDPKTDVRISVVRAFSVLVIWSEKAKRFMLRRKDFYLCLLKEVTEVFKSGVFKEAEYPIMLNSGLTLILHLYKSFTASEQEFLLDDVLDLIGTTLARSDSVPVLHNALMVLLAMRDQNVIYPRLRSQSGVPEAFKAIAACTAYNQFDRLVAARFIFRTSEIVIPPGASFNQDFMTEEGLQEFFVVLAKHDPAVERRVQRLAAASESPISRSAPRHSRKCSNPSCDKVEETEKFKVCRGCLLEIYCGTDCQKAAWKGGHKDTCPRRDRHSSKR